MMQHVAWRHPLGFLHGPARLAQLRVQPQGRHVTRNGFSLSTRLQKSPRLQAAQAVTARTPSVGHMTSAHQFARAVIVVEMVDAPGFVLMATMESVLVRKELQDI